MDSKLGDLYNELMCLCEIRGECGDEGNARIEERIKATQFLIQLRKFQLEKEGE